MRNNTAQWQESFCYNLSLAVSWKL